MLKSYRCTRCGKLLAKDSKDNCFEIKCLRCGMINNIFLEIKEQIIITDQNEKILYANELVEQVTGYTADEIVGKKPSIWGGQMPREFYENMKKALFQEKRSIVTEVTNKHKSGKKYRALLRISPILDTTGEILFFVGIERVIDKQKTDNPVIL